jgi:hypothetical protein
MRKRLTARINLGKTNGKNDAEEGPDARRRGATTEAWAAHSAGRSDEPTKQMGRHRRRGTSV